MNDIERLYQEAENAEKSRDFEASLQCYRKILSLDPNEEQAYYGAANLHAIRGQVPLVVKEYLMLADVLERKGSLDAARDVCTWVTTLEPTNTQARLKLVDLLEKEGDAEAVVGESISLARIFSALGHDEQAVALLGRLLEIEPEHSELALELGEIYIKQGQIGEGLELYKSIAARYLDEGNDSKALEVLKRIKVIKYNDYQNLEKLGKTYLKLGRLEEAKAEYRQILRADLNHAEALFQLGLIAKMQGAWDEARLPFRKLVELNPQDPLAREYFGETNEAIGNQVEAIRHYLVAGDVYEHRDDKVKAAEMYQNVLALDEEHAAARQKLSALGAPRVPKKRIEAAASPAAPIVRAHLESKSEEEIAATLAKKKLVPKGLSKLGSALKNLKEQGKKSVPGKEGVAAKTVLEGGIPRTKLTAKPVLSEKFPPGIPAAEKPLTPERKEEVSKIPAVYVNQNELFESVIYGDQEKARDWESLERSDVRELLHAEETRLSSEARQLEEARLAEETGRMHEARAAEAARAAEEARLAGEFAKAEAARLAEQRYVAEEAAKAEQSRVTQEARTTEEARLAAEFADAREVRLNEESRLAKTAGDSEEARSASAARKVEDDRLVRETRRTKEARKAEAARLTEEAKRREEKARLAEAALKARASRLAEEARKAEEARLAEAARQAEEARVSEASRKAEEARTHAAEERFIEEAQRAEEIRLAETARNAEEARLAMAARRIEETKITDELSRLRGVEETRRLEAARLAEAAEKTEEARLAVLARLAEEARLLDETRHRAAQARALEAARKTETLHLEKEAAELEKIRLALEAERVEKERILGGVEKIKEARLIEESRLLETARAAEEFRLAEQARKAEAVRLSRDKEKAALAAAVNAKIQELQHFEKWISEGKVGQAITSAEKALSDYPDYAPIKRGLADAYYQYGSPEKALPLYKELAYESQDPELYLRYAEAALLCGKFDLWGEAASELAEKNLAAGNPESACLVLGRVLCWNPNHVKARRLLIEAYRKEKLEPLVTHHIQKLITTLENAKATEALVSVLEEVRTTRLEVVPIREKLASAYQELGKTDSAKAEFRMLAQHYQEIGELGREADALERVLSIDPADRSVMVRLKSVYARLGKKEAALRFELKLGDAEKSRGDLDAALLSYGRILDEDPENEEALTRTFELYLTKRLTAQAIGLSGQLSQLYAKSRQNKKAISVYETLLRIEPENPDLHRGFGELYARLGYTREAVAQFMTLGHLTSVRGMFDESIAAYRQVAALDPSAKDAHYQLGILFADHKNNLEGAILEFNKVRALDPHFTAALYRLAKGYSALGNVEGALSAIRDLVREDPTHANLVEELAAETEAKLSRDPENWKLHFDSGILNKEILKLDEAIREFQAVIRKAPELALSAYAYQGLCWEAKASRENDEALLLTARKVYEKGLSTKGAKEEELLELKYNLARLHETVGEVTAALAIYQDILSLDMSYRDARQRKKLLEEEKNSKKVTRLRDRKQESGP